MSNFSTLLLEQEISQEKTEFKKYFDGEAFRQSE